MKHSLIPLTTLLLVTLATLHAADTPTKQQNVPDLEVDWPAFLARHDMLWKRLQALMTATPATGRGCRRQKAG